MTTDSDDLEVEEMVEEPGGDGKTAHRATDVDGSQSPIQHTQSIQAGRAPKTSKCAFCRRDHKKCVRTSDSAKCERCHNLNYSCFGGLEAAASSAPKRVLNRYKCDYCRDAKQKCLPVDRCWPNICERCREKGLPCSEPVGTRKRQRVDKGPSSGTNHLETEAHLHSHTVQSTVANQATPPETPQPFPFPSASREPLLPTSAHSTLPNDSNLAMLSRAADIHQKDNIVPSLRDSSDNHAVNKRQAIARARWQRAFKIIRRGVRIRDIASIFLYAPQDNGIVLCNVCTQLGLSRERFVVEARDHPSWMKREPLYLQDRLWPKPAEGGRDFSLEDIQLGNVGTIRRRGHICAFCRLVWNAVQDQNKIRNSKYGEIDMIMAYATWQTVGRQYLPGVSTKPRNRRIRLHWSKGTTESSHNSVKVLNEAFIVLVADSRRAWDSNFLGRPIEIGKSIVTITKDWIEQCQHHHLHSNMIIPYEGFYWSEAVSHKFRLLDVLQMRTVSPEHAAPQYVALSWAWTGEQSFNLPHVEVEAFERLGERGAVQKMWPKLPRTIQDAITLVQELQFRYLWVDVLCTTYDASGLDRPAMAKVFSNAFLTICAADGCDPNTGLVAFHTPRKPVIQHIQRFALGLELMVSHPAETCIGQSLWNRWGWTFQERFLSNRCLIFAAERVYWECRDATACEDIIENSREPSWSVDMLDNPLKIMGDLQDQPRAIRAYMRCVEAYTLRQLWDPDDILRAFEGVYKVIGISLKTDALYSLPSAFLDLALLWDFKEAPNERQCRQSSGILTYPSWSWCGWEGSIAYRTSTLSGILGNIRAWMSKHTWISWYVRDRYGITRLIDKYGKEPITFPRTQTSPKLESPVRKFKTEDKWVRDRASFQQESREVAIPSYQQQPVKWPAQNRSVFFKSVPNLQFDTMDLDSEALEDLEHRDTKYLQFWTWSGFFRLNNRPLSNSSDLGPGLSRFGILDYKDDFCGTIVLPDHLVLNGLGDTAYELIAISEAKDFTPEEFIGWNYYIPKERDESEWDLWYVLLVEKVDEVVVRRVGLGKVFQEAFENSCSPGKEWKEFIMA